MSALPETFFHVEFTTPEADIFQTLNFYPIPKEMDLQDVPDLILTIKRMQEQEKNYIVFNNINQVTNLAQSDTILPQNLYFCLLWRKKEGQMMGLLFEKSESENAKPVGIWNLPKFEDIGELERYLNEDLSNIQDGTLYETVSLFY